MNCRNCNTQVVDESHFCTNCGEKIPFKRLTTKSILTSAIQNFLDIDNKFLKTFRNLFIKPEVVIDDYAKGFRKNFVNVIGYLGIGITFVGLQFFILKKFYPEVLSVNSEGPKNHRFDIQEVMNVFYDYQGLITMLLIPVFSVVSWLLFIDSKKYNIAEHFVINAYTTSQGIIVMFFVAMITSPLGISYSTLTLTSIIPLFIYMTFVFKRLYNISTISSLVRTIAYFIISNISTMMIVMIAALIYGIYLGFTGQFPVKTI